MAYMRTTAWLVIPAVFAMLALTPGCGQAPETDEQPEQTPNTQEAPDTGADNEAPRQDADGDEGRQGEMTPEGLKFTVPFERGDGSITLSRQDGMLRVDTLVMMPYHGGDHQDDLGAHVRLVFSVNGRAGRMLMYHPSPVWMPNPSNQPAPFRMESRFDREQVQRVAERPSFAGEADIAHYDRWYATVFVDTRRLVMPGNTPDSRADLWYFGAVLGSRAGLVEWPTGLNQANPSTTPEAMVRIRLSDLPERPATGSNPMEPLEEAENAMVTAQQRLMAQQISRQTLPRVFSELKTYRDEFPTHLWPRDLLYQFSMLAAMHQIDGVDTDYARYLKDCIEVAPGQSRLHTEYIRAVMARDFDGAKAHYDYVMQTPMVTGRPTTRGFMMLEWAETLINWGYVDMGREVIEAAGELDAVQQDASLRVNYGLAYAALAIRQGDSRKAAEHYQRVLTTETGRLDPRQMQPMQAEMQYQSQAAEQWEEELEFQAEDAEKRNPRLILETDKGRIVIELFEDDAPNTVASLVSLASDGFYNGLKFHRVEPNFVAQGGCPKGNGMGHPGYRLKREVSRRNHFRGTVAMARAQAPDSAGSQFYICVSNSRSVLNLSGEYAVVGRVIEGMEVADMLRVGDKMNTVRVENLRDHAYEPETLPAEEGE
jgi:peptidyl-prolyl cis-trans isomerase B (cyclophilin B)